MYREKRIGVVVPAYNEELLIVDTLSSIPDFVDRIYVVNDCSKDNTKRLIEEYAVTNPRVIPHHHDENGGVGAAIITGYKNAISDSIDVIAIMAGDNQMSPDHLSKLLDPIISGDADITKGNRLTKDYWKGMSLWRHFGNCLLSSLTKVASGYWYVNDPQNGYVAISLLALKKFDLDALYKRYAFENDVMIKGNILGLRMMNVAIPAIYAGEVSGIRYGNFIITTSIFLLKSFIWRLWEKYLTHFNMMGLIYILGITGMLVGVVAFIWTPLIFFIGVILFILACLMERHTQKEFKQGDW